MLIYKLIEIVIVSKIIKYREKFAKFSNETNDILNWYIILD